MAAVLLFPIDDAFAFSITLFDDEKYTISGYEDDRLYYHSIQKDGAALQSGTNLSHDGWMSPYLLPDSNVPGSYTWTWFSDNARTNQIAQVSWVRDIPADTTPPVITVPNDIIFLNPDDPAGLGWEDTRDFNAQVLDSTPNFPPSATDDVDGYLGVAICHLIDNAPPINTNPSTDWAYTDYAFYPSAENDISNGTFIIICYAIDAAGNTGTASFTITVENPTPSEATTPPVITVPNDITITVGSPILNIQNFPPTGSDNKIVGLPVTCYESGGTTFNGVNGWDPILNSVGVHPITCTAVNSAGGGAASFTITVTTTEDPPPYITVSDDITITTSDIVEFNLKDKLGSQYIGDLGNMRGAIAMEQLHPNFNNVQPPDTTANGSTLLLNGPDIVRESSQGGIGCWGNFFPQGWINGPVTFPIGTTTVTCGAVYGGVEHTETFTVTVIEDTGNVPTSNPQSYTVLVNEMRGSIAANDPGGCASFNPQTCYTPSDITINVGDSVTWVNNDSTNNWYTLMGNWGSLASSSGDNACDGPGKLALDMCGVSGNDRTSWTHTFDAVGTYNYHDWVYQNSAQRPEGVVNVVASGAPAPVTPVTPTLGSTSENTDNAADTTPPVITVPT